MRWFYLCSVCGREYPIEPDVYLCPVCAAGQKENRPLEGILECAWEGMGPADDVGIPLPVESGFFPLLPVGSTPLWEPKRLRDETGFPNLYFKDDTCNPSGSLKDRASFLVAAFATMHGIGEIALASTGNAASSMACVGAAAGLKITVFLPKTAPVAKRVQVLQYGAALHEVEGNYDEAFEESLSYSKKNGVLSRNTAYNPLTIEGKKTVSFEIARDLAKAQSGESGADLYIVPDHIFVPVGDGTIIAGVYKGFEDLLTLGRTTRMPTVWACQAAGSSALSRAFGSGGFGDPVSSATVADSIAVDVPRNGTHALMKLKKFGGRPVIVGDGEILSAQKDLASMSGLFAEPSSSAAWAGFLKARGQLQKSDSVVILITGSGLKDIAGALKGLSF